MDEGCHGILSTALSCLLWFRQLSHERAQNTGHPKRQRVLGTSQPRRGAAPSPRGFHSTPGRLVSPYTHWSPKSLNQREMYSKFLIPLLLLIVYVMRATFWRNFLSNPLYYDSTAGSMRPLILTLHQTFGWCRCCFLKWFASYENQEQWVITSCTRASQVALFNECRWEV